MPRLSSLFLLQYFPCLPLFLFSSCFFGSNSLVWFGVTGAFFLFPWSLFTFFIPYLLSSSPLFSFVSLSPLFSSFFFGSWTFFGSEPGSQNIQNFQACLQFKEFLFRLVGLLLSCPTAWLGCSTVLTTTLMSGWRPIRRNQPPRSARCTPAADRDDRRADHDDEWEKQVGKSIFW